MPLARITLIQTEAQLNLDEKSITDSWSLTDSQGQTITAFDKDTLLATIINKGGQFGVVHQDPDYFYLMSAYFWKRWKYTFANWFETAKIEYNPIENTDYIETFKENTGNTKVVDSDTSTSGTANTESSGSNTGSNSTDNEVFGFNYKISTFRWR